MAQAANWNRRTAAKAAGASVEFAKQQASKMLIEIAAKSAGPSSPAEDTAHPGKAK